MNNLLEMIDKIKVDNSIEGEKVIEIVGKCWTSNMDFRPKSEVELSLYIEALEYVVSTLKQMKKNIYT